MSKLRAWLLYCTTFGLLQFLFNILTKFGLNECFLDPRDIGIILQAWPLSFKHLYLFMIFSSNLDYTNVSQIYETLVLSLRHGHYTAKPSKNSVFCYFVTIFGLKECLSDPRNSGMALEAWPLWSSTFGWVHLNIIFLTRFRLNKCLLDSRDKKCSPSCMTYV